MTWPTSQFARPSSDISKGTWTASTGTDLYAMIDETVAVDTDYILGPNAADGTCVLGLSAIDQPEAGTCTLRVRVARSGSSAGIDLVVTLKEGASIVTTFTIAGPPQTFPATYEHTFSSVLITDPDGLSVELVQDWTTGSSNQLAVTWLELETPLPGGGGEPTIVTGAATLVGSGSLSASGLNIVKAAATMTGGAGLSGDALNFVPAAGNFEGSGSLSGSALSIVLDSGTLVGSGELSATARVNALGAATLVGAGELSGSGKVIVLGQATLTGLANLQGSTTVTVLAASELVGSGQLQGSAMAIVQAVASLIGSGTLQASGRVVDLSIKTPDGRIYHIPLEVRSMVIDGEIRTFVIPAENRTYEVQ